MQKFLDLVRRFRKDERGAFIALFGVLAVVLVATAGATVDFTSVQNARTRAQVALDAAALALQPEVYKGTYNRTQVMAKAEALMLNRLGTSATNDDNDDTKPIKAKVTDALISDDKTTVTITASLKVPLYFVSLVGIKTMSMTLVTQTTRGSQDLEVSVALDVTGSMLSNDKIGALKEAANSMVDILVLDQQEPTYSKMALVPWSVGVNLGSYATSARGTTVGPKTVTTAAWQIGSNKTVSGSINRANPARVTTTAAHGLATGDFVWISGLSNTSGSSGWTALNNRAYTITVTSTTRFTLNGIATNTGSFSGSSTGGTVRECLNSECEVVITHAGHGLSNNDLIFFTGVGGMTQLNSSAANITAENPTYFTVAASAASTFQLDGIYGPNVSAWTSGGQFYCVKYGCDYYRFQAPDWWGTWNLHPISTCVSERVVNPYQYTDTAPSTAPVGLNYTSTGNPCPASQVVPLTSNKTTLHSAINGLVATGSTAGQIGTAWAWYMLAPNFASLWPSANQPAAYNSANLIKVVVLMTDGSFNSFYCNGVISADSTTGSGSASDHINCNATNGNPFTQAKNLCDAMKLNTGILVYTVGFDVADQTNEKDMLSYCASDSSKYYLAENETELIEAFEAIAQDIAQLRLSE